MGMEPSAGKKECVFRLRPWYRRPMIWIVLGLLACLVLREGYSIFRGPSFRPFEQQVGTDPCDLRFEGVRKNYGDDLFSADGRFLRKEPGINVFTTHWDPEILRREFLFDIPVTDDSFKFAGPVRIYLNGYRGYSVRPRALRIKSQHSTRLIIDAALPCLSLRSKSALSRLAGEPVRFVDIEMTYYCGPPSVSETLFTGPFVHGQTKSDDSQGGYTLRTVSQHLSPENLELRLFVTTPQPPEPPLALRLVLTDGTTRVYQRTGVQGNTVHYLVPGLLLDQIRQITFNEPPWKKTFAGIAVDYVRKGPAYAAFLDEYCQRLGISPTDRAAVSESVHQTEFVDANDALDVLDCVRGRAVIAVCNSIRHQLRVDRLEVAEQERVRKIANEWLGTEMAPEGIALGLWGNWPEFVEPALQWLKWSPFNRQSARDLANAFQYRTDPTDRELREVGAFLIRRKTKTNEVRRDLIRFLRLHVHTTAGQEALIAVAECDKPWIWTSVIQPGDVFARLAEEITLPHTVQLRALALGMTDHVQDANALMPQAGAQLAQCISPEFVQKNAAQFCRVIQALARHGDPRRDTPALLHYLDQQLRHWTSYKAKRGAARAPVVLHNHIGIEKTVKLINRWHEIDIAGMGTQLDRPCHKACYNWRDVARTALAWGQHRTDPSLLPAGWQLGRRDVRVIWHDQSDPGQSVVSLWPFGSLVPGRMHYQRVRARQDDLLLAMHIPLEQPSLPIQLRVSVRHDTKSSQSQVFFAESDALPATFYLTPADEVALAAADGWPTQGTIVVERAAALDSVLSGTPLFEAWKQVYLQETPLKQAQPMVFLLIQQ
jgi:hypothetical protein